MEPMLTTATFETARPTRARARRLVTLAALFAAAWPLAAWAAARWLVDEAHYDVVRPGCRHGLVVMAGFNRSPWPDPRTWGPAGEYRDYVGPCRT